MSKASVSFLEDNEDLQFYVHRWIDWSLLANEVELQGFSAEQSESGDGYASAAEAKDVWLDVLALVSRLAAEEVAPVAAHIDRAGLDFADGKVLQPPEMEALFQSFAETGLHGLCVPRELGGMNAPLLVYFLSLEMLSRADVSVAAHFGFHGGIAMALLMYSALEGSVSIDPTTKKMAACRFEGAVRDIIENAQWGSMDITEPGAGSDVGAVRTRGDKCDDGSWTVTGQKIFITSGHGRYHVVLARTEAAGAPDDPMAGLSGLSLFLVDAHAEDGNGASRVTLSRLEEKLGHHGSATVAVNFDAAPAQLIGERGQGFKQMLLLMNNARIGVGFEGLGLCESAYRLARDYASERRSMGRTIDKHELVADMLDEMQSTIMGLRALAVDAAVNEELSQRKRLKLLLMPPTNPQEKQELEQEVARLSWTSRLNTPLLKYLASESAVDMARKALQIHGGYGYTSEYGAEKLLRDSLVLPIYEGTSQIQALMATKDALQFVLKDPRAFVRKWAEAHWDAWVGPGPHVRRVAALRVRVLDAQRRLMLQIATEKVRAVLRRPVREWRRSLTGNWDMRTDFGPALLHAERLTRLMIDLRVAEVLAEQVRQVPSRSDALVRWLERAEPRSKYLYQCIVSTGRRLRSTILPASNG